MRLQELGWGSNVYKTVVGNLHGRPKRRWDDNIKMNFRERGCKGGR
jgi:hypothetical protein